MPPAASVSATASASVSAAASALVSAAASASARQAQGRASRKMGVGQIADQKTTKTNAVLAGFMIYPLIRLGKLFDQIADTVRESGEHAIPALDEGVTTVKQVYKSLEDVNRISAAASSTANNVGALTDLYGSFRGKPGIKIASFFYALKSTAQSFVAKKSTGRDSVEGSGQQESKAQ